MNYTKQLMVQDVAEVIEKEGLKDLFLATDDLKLKEGYAAAMIMPLRYFVMGRYNITGKEAVQAIHAISAEVEKDIEGFLAELSSVLTMQKSSSVQ